jgi:hypothetical protein
LTIHLEEGKCFDAEMYHQDLNLPVDAKSEDQRINLAKWVLTFLFYNYLKHTYPNNPSFYSATEKDKKVGLPTLNLNGISNYTSSETPSMNLTIATPLKNNMDTPASIPHQSTTPFTAVGELPNDPMSPTTATTENPMETDPSKSSKTVPARSTSFIEKFKFRRQRSMSGKSDDSTSSKLNSEKPDGEELIRFEETPFIKLPELMPISISMEQSMSMYIDIHHGTVKDMNKIPIELIPQWIQDWIINVINEFM